MVEIKMLVSDVNYDDALETLLPVLLKHLEKKKNPLVLGAVRKLRGAGVPAAKLVLKALPQKTRDELAAVGVNYYKDDIAKYLSHAAQKKGIELTVNEVSVTSLDS